MGRKEVEKEEIKGLGVEEMMGGSRVLHREILGLGLRVRRRHHHAIEFPLQISFHLPLLPSSFSII